MSKRKKTRQQKIISDLRRKISTAANQSVANHTTHDPQRLAYTLLEAQSPEKMYSQTPSAQKHLYTTASTQVLLRDLRKTGMLIASIVVFELLLFLLLRNHSIRFPGISY